MLQGRLMMKSLVVKRSIVLAGHKTSVSLEDEFWSALKEVAAHRGMTISEVVRETDTQRQHSNLSSAIRLLVLEFYRGRISAKLDGEKHDVTSPKTPPVLS